MGTEQIVVLMHRPGERILDRHETAVRVVLLDRAKEVLERDARNDARVGAEHGNRSSVAERSRFSLDGDAGHASVTAPRLLLETRRVYLARTPDLYRGGGVHRARRRSRSRCETSILSSRRSASIVIASPSSTRASGPPTTASGAT